MSDAVSVDGSMGEGGGQVLRTSIALSVLLQTPVRVHHIRAGRVEPGLRPQHIAGIKAAEMVCGAETEGVSVGSTEVFFKPNKVCGGEYALDVGTAGSITLVLQTLMLACAKAENVFFRIRGGTDVKWSPTAEYLMNVTSPLLNKFGFNFKARLLKRGYYPHGGGIMEFCAGKSSPKRIRLTERGKLKSVGGLSHAHVTLSDGRVSERQSSGARKALFEGFSSIGVNADVRLTSEYCDAFSVGSGITLWADCGNVALGSSSLGERGKRAEKVGEEAALRLIEELSYNAPADSFMADQIIPYVAFSGGDVRAPILTSHATTNVEDVRLFGLKLNVDGNLISSD